ncbi:alpha/beta hydrolase [Pseudoponticoccus marisrubri]|uniref:Uncharacterized protein n=1 Tax=Pseudoponticoccus marisrubri TaxID=1685382 RepID=A0A0W7WNK4_9RHOB|nr:alpha/beta hydrolase [Pseudoponticoccus marisrubri]KUF12084.1 hypothetical protein AVJ23_05805 [Pseudoponticoccus marisrubri]
MSACAGPALALQPGEVDAYLAAQEARFDDIRPGQHKRVVWAGAPGVRTGWAVLYVHGFSASSEELRPLPDRVAAGLGANLVFTRLAGHGRGGAAMAEATLADWMRDVAEGFALGRAVGERVLVLACSTGATLVTLGACGGTRDGIAGAVMLSPNFRLRRLAGRVLGWPGAAHLAGPFLRGTRGFVPFNAAHAAGWTSRYPSQALLPMGAAVAAAGRAPLEQLDLPALFLFDPGDRVVDHRATERVAARWGGPARLHRIDTPQDCDPGRHVIAGQALSPALTGPVCETVLGWARGL